MKNKVMTFRQKLCLYFILFAAIIFIILWILQTVFLQSFYNNMLILKTKNAASQISQNIDDNKFIDDISRDNSLLIFITDSDGNIIYSADPYKNTYGNDIDEPNENPYHQNEELNWQKAVYHSLPDNYEVFLNSLKENGKFTEYKTDTLYVYGEYISEDKILYLSTNLDPVGAAAEIIRIQLIAVTLISFGIAFFIAFVISKKFSEPISEISEQAANLGSDKFNGNFKKGSCTEIDELENTLKKTNSDLNKAKNFQRELLANISHDLRTPLTMIKGYGESIKDFGNDEIQRNSDCEIIIKEADRLNALVNEILEYSELQTESHIEKFEKINFSEITKNIISGIEPLFENQGGTIEKNISDNIFIVGNSMQIERVIYNLVDNAIRHSGKNKIVKITLEKNNDLAILSVKDTGKGIPEDMLEHIWDRYFTSRQRGKNVVSGLGLAIVKQIVLNHGGSCEVHSKINEGSDFIIKLPIKVN